MAFLKYANAQVRQPSIDASGWDDVRAQAIALGSSFGNRGAAFGQPNSQIVLQRYRPDQFLLSHCTIIASVDSEEAGLPLGAQMVDGFQIDRRYADYLVSPDSTKYINNNNDCWERRLLLACFKTFIGGENYVEHLQIPELSKGKIIDAAARDIGDSVYVDILVATDRKHEPLISAVTSGQLQTLSMGCQVAFTICTKCGNVAEDETNLCPHIRYMKGNHFLDGLGKTRKIAELCGHRTAEPGSVKFIEASWVANPAFTGAVLRNVLTPEEASLVGDRIQVAFSQGPRLPQGNAMLRAARSLHSFLDEPEFPGADEDGGDKDKDKGNGPLDDAINEMADFIREKALEKARGDMAGGELPRADMEENRNDTLVKEALRQSPEWRRLAKVVLAKVRAPKMARRMLLGMILHKRGGWSAIRQAHTFSGREILALSRLLDSFDPQSRIAGESRLYRAVIAVGGMAAYADVESYLAACRRVFGRELTGSEKDALITKGRLYDLGS